MAHDQAGVIYGLPLPTSVVEVAAGVQRPRRAKGKAAKRVEPEAEAPALAIAKAKAGAPRFVTGAGDVTAFEATGSSSNGSSEGSQSARASPLGTTTSGAADDDEDMAAGGAKGSTQAWNGCAARTAAGTAGTGTGIRAGKGEREGLWRTQSFEDRLSISSSAAAVDPATREEEVVVVDLVHEALQRAAHARASAHQLQLQLQGEQHGGPGLGGGVTPALAATAAATTTSMGEWRADDDGSGGGGDYSGVAMYFEAAARYLEELAASLEEEEQQDAGPAGAAEGAGVAWLAAAGLLGPASSSSM